MTETGKQGTSKAPATSAATETAVPEPAAQAGAEGREVVESGATEPGASEPSAAELGAKGAGGDAAKPDLEETKRKFREALERKNHAHQDGQGQGGRDKNKINGAHGPAASRRNFRRKSG